MKHLPIYANRDSHKDFVENAFISLTSASCGVNCAVAFFTHAETITRMTSRGCVVKLVVRLGYPTCPKALKTVLEDKNVQVRFVTSTTFHPKLFLFGEAGAIVGSANLTANALRVNQEVAVVIDGDDSRFEDLMSIFYDYWEQSKVLTDEILQEYKALHKKFDLSSQYRLETDIVKNIGDIRIQNINSGQKKKSKQAIYIDDYQKSYQEFLSAFSTLQSLYEKHGLRKVSESDIPLRIEIDSFISWVRDNKAPTDHWKTTPVLVGEKQNKFITELIEEWHESEYYWFSNEIVPKRYPLITQVLKSNKSIREASQDEIWDALNVCHSVDNQFRHVRGGRQNFKEDFFEKNDLDHLKEVIQYLIYGDEDYIVRMARCIYHKDYKVYKFGRAVIQELIAWVSRENLPICNGRTTKVMRFLGFDIRQVNEMG